MCFVPSCIPVDTLPSLEIVVLDQYDNPVHQAVVGVFDDLEQWGLRENPVQAWKLTDEDGVVTFLNLNESHYYFFVEKGQANNLKNEIKTSVPLLINTKRQLTIHID